MARSTVVAVLVFVLSAPSVLSPPQSSAAELQFLQPPTGYSVGKVSLGEGNIAFALAPDPADARFIYAAGLFDFESRIVRLGLRTSSQTVVCNCPSTVSVGGFAVYTTDTMFVSDSWNHQLLVLRDRNADGDFDDAGEIERLIEPILTDLPSGWTGNAVAIVWSAANRLGLPAGTVLFQSEDGGTTGGEVLAVVDPLTSPVYQPAGGAFFAGFNYGGGIAVDARGRLVVGSSFYPDPGKVWFGEDLSGDGAIGPDESSILVDDLAAGGTGKGLSGLAVGADNRAFACVNDTVSSQPVVRIQTLRIPWNFHRGLSPVETFGILNAGYVSSIIFNGAKSFAPAAIDGATMVIAASGPPPNYENYDYLLTLTPNGPLRVRQWQQYE